MKPIQRYETGVSPLPSRPSLVGLEGDLAEAAATRLETLAPRARRMLQIAIKQQFAGRIALVSSFGAESAVLLHLVAQIDRTTPVIFLDTGRHFAETLEHKKALCRQLEISNVVVARPDDRVIAEEDPERSLFARDPDRCCRIRKVLPLNRALEGFDAWITGRKSYQNQDRTSLLAYERAGRRVKINPLVDWGAPDVIGYLRACQLPSHPLVSRGFPSIGCSPCTSAVESTDPPRSGRWRGLAKTECGIHTHSLPIR
jgi:phosphoadenosine phosphosulfate reductase